jgi:hypothetical protein
VRLEMKLINSLNSREKRNRCTKRGLALFTLVGGIDRIRTGNSPFRKRACSQLLLRCWTDLFVQAQPAVWTLAETLDLPKRDRSNLAKSAAFALCPGRDGPIRECSEMRRAARATDEAKQVRANKEHEQQARDANHRNESAANDWCKQVYRGADCNDIANARKPVPSLVFRISEVLPQRHGSAFYDLRSNRASAWLTAIVAPAPPYCVHSTALLELRADQDDRDESRDVEHGRCRHRSEQDQSDLPPSKALRSSETQDTQTDHGTANASPSTSVYVNHSQHANCANGNADDGTQYRTTLWARRYDCGRFHLRSVALYAAFGSDPHCIGAAPAHRGSCITVTRSRGIVLEALKDAA